MLHVIIDEVASLTTEQLVELAAITAPQRESWLVASFKSGPFVPLRPSPKRDAETDEGVRE